MALSAKHSGSSRIPATSHNDHQKSRGFWGMTFDTRIKCYGASSMMEESLLTKFVKPVFIKQEGGGVRIRGLIIKFRAVYSAPQPGCLSKKDSAVSSSLKPSRQQRTMRQLREKQQTAGPGLLIPHRWWECCGQTYLSLSSLPEVEEQTRFPNHLNKEKNEKSPRPRCKL